MAEQLIAEPDRLPVGPVGRHGIGWWGVSTLVASEAALFSYLLFCYYYIGAAAQPGWLPENHPRLFPALPNTILLLASSGAAWIGETGIEEEKRGQALAGFAAAFVMGAIFAAVQGYEWWERPYDLGTTSFASLYFTTTGFHLAHVIVGLVILAALFGWTLADFFSPRRRISVSAGVLYWHFVDMVWLFVFTTYYITPYLGFAR